jgi:hypothetical protein
MSGAPLPRDLKIVLGRRRAPRVPMKQGGPVALVGARIVNVSPYGMLIHSPLPMETDAVLRFRLVIGAEKRDIDARVADCLPEGTRSYGVGLEFVGVADDFRTRMAQVLKPLPLDA